MAEGGKKDIIEQIIDIKASTSDHQLEYTSEEVELKDLEPGDHLAVKHKIWLFFTYYHHGILIDVREGVADFGGQRLSKMKIQLTDLAVFMKKSTLVRINYPTGTCLAPRATIALARELIEQPDLWGPYNLVTNNCEHLAIKCKTGLNNISTQVLKQIDICLKNPIKRLTLRKSGWFFRAFGLS